MGRLTDLMSFLAGRQAKNVTLPQVWEAERMSIFAFLQSLPPATSLSDEPVELPDENIVNQGKEIRWAAGALDGVMGHHGPGSTEKGEAVLAALRAAGKAPSSGNLKSLYFLLLEEGTLSSIDPVLTSIRQDPSAPLEMYYKIAMWLATKSPDREPVKFGIALLGIFVQAPSDLLLVLGRHDEFTLYAVVALVNTLPEERRDSVLWHLAKQVHGWGRIHIVERLSATTDPDIQAWLLREGYKNSIMQEYLAYACAAGGNLLQALRVENPDAALLRGAGDILVALVGGGPAESFTSYEDGAEATRLYVDHMAHMAPSDLDHFLSLSQLKRFVDETDRDWTELERIGWNAEIRQQLSVAIAPILAHAEWKALIEQDLQASDNAHFATAAEAARYAGMDIWERRFERQRCGWDDQWFFLMLTEEHDRISRVVALAIEQLGPTKPGTELGIGDGQGERAGLEFVLQGLERFPGLGWEVIDAGIQSPAIRDRNFAIRALSKWGAFSAEMIMTLEKALQHEPDDEVRESMRQILARNS